MLKSLFALFSAAALTLSAADAVKETKSAENKKAAVPQNAAEAVMVEFMKFVVENGDANPQNQSPETRAAFAKKAQEAQGALKKLCDGDMSKAKGIIDSIAKKYVPEFLEMQKKAEAGMKAKVQVIRSKSNIKTICQTCIVMIIDDTKPKVPTLETLTKELGEDASKVLTCPASGKAYEIVGSGQAYTGAADVLMVRSKLSDGREVLGYQDGHVEVK